MGFGYNGTLSEKGERIDILGFFSRMKLLEWKIKDWVIWDASAFYIVNRTPAKRIQDLRSGTRILEALITEQDNKKRSEIKRNCDLRSLYLKKLIEISGIRAQYFDSRHVFREDKRFAECFDVSLDYFARLRRDCPDFVLRIMPNNGNPASQLYFPLEIAESIYLAEFFGVKGKFGPISERFFDDCILDVQSIMGNSYATLKDSSCPESSGGKPAYLANDNVITTRTDLDEIKLILADPEFRRYFVASVGYFVKQGESLEEVIPRIQKALEVV